MTERTIDGKQYRRTKLPDVVWWRGDNRGECLIQLSTPRWWFGTGWPPIERPQYGNQLRRWSLWVRLPFHREIGIHGRSLQ